MADARARISWLHVSDLHVAKESLGAVAARRPGSELWAEVLRGFFDDLDEQLDATGLRPDLVLVTGDLAYSGAAKQYDDLDADVLRPLLAHLRSRSCDAVLLAVPGNHDVQRPSGASKRGYRLLREYDTLDDQDEDLRDLRAELWQQRNAAFLSPLFANYVAWTERSMLPGLAESTRPSGLRIEGLHRSHLPGDLSVIAARDGLRLLLVGLNSSWIQFDGRDFKGRLHVPLEQLHAALSPDEHAALQRFDGVDASLLLMHHPRDWLSPAATRTFDGYVYPARDERFSAFMFGHMHEARSETSSGNGGAMRYFYQSPSLFGLEHYGQTQARLDVGYTLGALYEDEEIRLWVRRLGRHGRFDVDPDLHRQADGALLLRSGRPRSTPRITLLPDHQRADRRVRGSDRAQLGAWLLSRHDKLELLAPSATFSYPFDEVYIPLEIAMQEAWRSRSPDGDLVHGMGRDIALSEIFARARDDREVMIFGNPGAGKTTTLEKICHQMLIEGGEAVGLPRATLPLLLPLRHATREDLGQDDPLLSLACREIVRGDAPLSAEVLARLWAQGELLLMLDGLDEVADVELREGLVRHVLRSAPARRRQGVRHIVSSRFSGVTRAIHEVLDSSFLRLDVRPLRRDRIEALVHSWFRAAKCWQAAPRTTEDRAEAEAEARADAERVLAELRRIEHEDFEFKNLVATPLLLTLLCAVALANRQIPHKRPEFYQRCLEVLLRRYTLKTGRTAPVQEPDALRILQEVAHGLHEARRRDGLSAETFAAWASRRAERSGRARMGPAEAAELLEWLHQHAGVLTKFGHDDYGFAHLTFQEYLCALHIAYGGETPIETLADRFGDPWWQEVTLLCLALPMRRTFEVFMTRVLEGDRWLADALGEDEGAPEVQRESKLPMQLLRECWEDSEERTVEPFLRVLQRPRAGSGWLGWVRGLLGRAEGAQARIDRQRIGVMQLLLGETDGELVTLAKALCADPKESDAVRAIASELVSRARRTSAMPMVPEARQAREVRMTTTPLGTDDDIGNIQPHSGFDSEPTERLQEVDVEDSDEQVQDVHMDDLALVIPPHTLKIRPRDADLSLDITFEGTLAILRNSEQYAHSLARNVDDLRQQIIVQAETFLSTEVGINEIFFSIRSALPKRFTAFVSPVLTRHDRALVSSTFHCRFSEQSPYLRAVAAPSENQYFFIYSSPNYPNTIKVQISYNLKLVDVQKFVTAKITDLEAWMNALLESNSRELLFPVSHRELCNNFQRTKRQLQERVQADVERIGYRLEQFYTITDHQLDQLMMGVEIEPIEGSYILKESGQAHGHLRTVLRVRLTGVDKVVERVARNEVIIEQISKTVDREIASFLRRTKAEDFYLFFEFPNPTDTHGEALHAGVGGRLEAAISEALKEAYDADVILLTFTPLETEVHQRHKRLTKEVHMTNVVVQRAGAPAETFQLEYRVLSVAPTAWQIFYNSEPDVDKVSQMLQRELSSKLAFVEPMELAQTTKRVHEAASAFTKERALKDFGLVVEVENFVRLSSNVEEKRIAAIQSAMLGEIGVLGAKSDAAIALADVERSTQERRVIEMLKRAEGFEARAQELRVKEDDEAENLEQKARRLRQEASMIVEDTMKTGMGKLLVYSEALRGENTSAFGVLPKPGNDVLIPSEEDDEAGLVVDEIAAPEAPRRAMAKPEPAESMDDALADAEPYGAEDEAERAPAAVSKPRPPLRPSLGSNREAAAKRAAPASPAPPPLLTPPPLMAGPSSEVARAPAAGAPVEPRLLASASPSASPQPAAPAARPPAEPVIATTPVDAPAPKPSGPGSSAPGPSSAPGGRAEGGAPIPRTWASSVEVSPPAIDIDVGDVCIEPITKIRFLLLESGSFMMGSEEDEPDSFDDERPRHLTKLNAFWLAETPVTNAQYAEYVKADGAAREPRYWRDRGLSGRDQPVVAVSWYEARAFCEWLSRASGWIITLPSEAQWEYAARGRSVEGRRYPWGNEPPDETRACFGLSTSTGRTAPVGQYPLGRGPFGHLDLVGNVWEWCRDTGDPTAYARADLWSRPDPVVDDPGAELRVCRGGGWYDPAPALRAARRTLCPGVGSSGAQGFRVCRLLDVR